MNIKKLQKTLQRLYGGRVAITEDEYSRILTGRLDSWQEVVACGRLAVDDTKQRYVVNNIQLANVDMPAMRLPAVVDDALEGKQVDVLVIGGGISGVSILRELMRYNVAALLVDKESDIAMQATGRNDGQVHVGIDLKTSTTKFKYVLRGNKMFDKLCRDLDVPFERRAQTVVMKGNIPFIKGITTLFARSRRTTHNLPDTTVLEGDKLLAVEPQIGTQHSFAMVNSCSGSVCPYNLAIAYAENAVDNGAEVSLNTAVLGMHVEGGRILSVSTNRGRVYPAVVINASGTFADCVADMAGDKFYSIHPRRGTNSILDSKAGHIVNNIASTKWLKRDTSHSKGGGLVKTAHHNVLVGPNAHETYLREDFSTCRQDVAEVFTKQKITNSNLHERDIITYFGGVRASTYEEDFVICSGKHTANIIHCAGIQSPGLTTAPAIAEDIVQMTVDMLSISRQVTANRDFDPIRHAVPNINQMNDEMRDRHIKANSDYGVIVCRCEQISKGEIIDALNRPICVPTIDGIKKRIRPGMGRCQGGFCSPLVASIIAEHQQCDISSVNKANDGSHITYGSTKEVQL